MITSITKDSVVLVTGPPGWLFFFLSREASEVALLTAIPNRPVLLRARFREREKERERERERERENRREDENRVYDILVPPAPVYQHRDRKWT